jgi:hypothetical protein
MRILTLRTLAPASLVSLLALVVGCSSSSFVGDGNDAASADAPTDGPLATGDDGALVDAAADVPVDPCAASPGVAKLCLNVQQASGASHPPYGGAPMELGLDGKGKLAIGLWTSDPGATSTLPAPTRTVTFPTDTSELSIDTDFPRTIPLTLSAAESAGGTVWLVGWFLDSTTIDRGPKGTDAVAGDFIVAPTYDSSMHTVLPKTAVAVGSTAKVTLSLAPLRRIDVPISLDAAAYTDPNANGDGVVLFDFFPPGGDPSMPAALAESKCITFGMLPTTVAFPPPKVTASAVTTATGTLGLYGAFVDYVGATVFPPNGAMLNVTSLMRMPPTVTIDSTSWVTGLSGIKMLTQQGNTAMKASCK